ncbi:MAG: citrate synthase [Myxococcales bacterium]|nr:citrate synthase [Myxococcales bacterium]
MANITDRATETPALAPLEPAVGLEGVVVAETRLSHVDGLAGRLEIAGCPVQELATVPTEEVAALLWRVASGVHGPPLRAALGRARLAAHRRAKRLGDALGQADAMDALRASVAHLSAEDDEQASAIALTAAVAVFAAHASRKRRGLKLVQPDPELGHAEDYLRLLRGEAPAPEEAQALQLYWASVVDHGMNASTFAARVVASTGSDLVSAVTAALGALKGPLHGGAPGPVLDMLHTIATPDAARPWLEASLARGERIMGMGHRVYRVRDPRAEVLEGAVRSLCSTETKSVALREKLELARRVEQEATELLRARHPARSLSANVEFYTAVLLDALGIASADFTPTFAAGRVIGWCAHVMEQRRTGRLIRPSSIYRRPERAQA